MKRMIKIIFLLGLFFCNAIVHAQTEEKYIADENSRVLQAQVYEANIQQFISENLSSYNLTQEYIDNINANMSTGNEEPQNLTQAQFLELLDSHKKLELRKLYFEEHPGIDSVFTALPKPAALQINCINGGFENGLANYTFRQWITNSPLLQVGACQNNALGPFAPTPATNQFQAGATLVTPGLETILSALNPPVQIQRVMTGNRALKLNPTPLNRPGTVGNDGETGNTTRVSRVFTIDENQIQISYLLVGKDAQGHRSPQFSVRLFNDATNVEIATIAVCEPIDATNPNVIAVNDTRTGWANTPRLFYTPNWITRIINIPPGFIGTNVRIEFAVSDCLMRGHFGTVYLDNICGITCDDPVGTVNLMPANITCPSEPFNICGTYQLPNVTNALVSLTLTILDAANNPLGMPITVPTALDTVNKTFCFSINPTLFGITPSGDYTFKVVAINNNNCEPRRTVEGIGGNLSFDNCCQPTLTSALTFTAPVNVQRSDWISSADVFNGVSARGIYHANNFVELTPGFQTINDAQFSAYIAECLGTFVYKNTAAVENNNDGKLPVEKSALVKITNQIMIYPNPSNHYITVTAPEKMKKITVSSLDGKTIIIEVFSAASRDMNVGNFADGMYLITVETQNGQFLQSKFIKN